MLTEIITRKDGGSKGGASHKAHMSYYNHMRRMKKKNHSMGENGLGFGLSKKEQDLNFINSDLNCVMIPDNSSRASSANRKVKSTRSETGDNVNLNIQKKDADVI